MVSLSLTSKNPMPQEDTEETSAPPLENRDRLCRLLFVSALSCLSVAGIALFVSDIVELIQMLVAGTGARHP